MKNNTKKKEKEKKFFSPTKQKVILLLLTGVALGLSHSPRQHRWIFKQLSKEWENIDRQYLHRIIREFKYERLIDWKEKDDGFIDIILTERGKKQALSFNIEKIEIKKPVIWDKKWRVVFYDIPEKRKMTREALRKKLKELDFYELQKSVFIHPFPCKDEVDFIVEFFDARNFVRYGELANLTNEASLKVNFDI